MKKIIAMLTVILLVVTLPGCRNTQDTPNGDVCPGKEVGNEGAPMTMAEGFDPSVDMSFNTVDTRGNPVTNEIFTGTERGVWLVFWQTDNEKSLAELTRLNEMLPIAKENGYKIVGIVMDGAKNTEKAKEMTAELGFDSIIWNDEVAARFDGVAQFFSKEYYDENLENYKQFETVPNLGDPVSTMANSRGQIQTSCILIPVSNEVIVEMWKNNNSNATFEELKEQEQNALSK